MKNIFLKINFMGRLMAQNPKKIFFKIFQNVIHNRHFDWSEAEWRNLLLSMQEISRLHFVTLEMTVIERIINDIRD